MIALDTNLLVRLLVHDDPVQVSEVSALLKRCEATGESCLVTNIVLCELGWVLASAYGVKRAEIAEAIQRIAANPLFAFESKESLQAALDLYRAGRADFSDYLIATTARDRGAISTYTFDKKLRGSELFTVL